MHYSYPGNVRELENIVKRIVVLESEEPILAEILRVERGERGGNSLRELIEEIERTAGEVPLREVGRRASLEAERLTIDRALTHTHWNRKRAARMLGVSYKTLLQKIRDCGSSRPEAAAVRHARAAPSGARREDGTTSSRYRCACSSHGSPAARRQILARSARGGLLAERGPFAHDQFRHFPARAAPRAFCRARAPSREPICSRAPSHS
jgi:hypothetical protein